LNLDIRIATSADIPAMHRVRMSVMENVLFDPSKVQSSDYERMIRVDGRGWACHVDGAIRGFSFADQNSRNIWALFVEPGFECRGIGRRLLNCAVMWLFDQGAESIWLTTQPGTRAEKFYRAAGWEFLRIEPSGEFHFSLTR
jgi:GNAT superfamily N-acetyltransferase